MNLVFTSKDIENYGVDEAETPGQFSAKISKQNIMNENTVKAHVVYTVSSQVIIKLFLNYPSSFVQYPDGKSAVVNRRYNDFEWLQKSLESKHKDILIPPIPEKDALGMFQLIFEILNKSISYYAARFHASVLQYRKREFNRFLARITMHPILKEDNNVTFFLTASDEVIFLFQ